MTDTPKMTNEKPLACSVVHHVSTPAPISALSFTSSGSQLLAGSGDGSIRLYEVSSPKVIRAWRALGTEVSSVVTTINKRPDEVKSIYVACGRHCLVFSDDSSKMISTRADAHVVLELGEDDEDVLNELSINTAQNQLGFSTDSGTIGVVDLSTKKINRMKKKHDSICGSVKFVPDRSDELVSGGYDSALLQFDFVQGTMLSRQDIPASPPSSGIALSPPFVLSMSISPSGIIAAGTADGQLWIGANGRKQTGKKKRSRRWEGLRPQGSLMSKIAEGPVVAVEFIEDKSLIVCTLRGTVISFDIFIDEGAQVPALSEQWRQETRRVAKVNCMAIYGEWIVIGGFEEDGRGIAEVWRRQG